MPHIVVEYSKHLENEVKLESLLEELHLNLMGRDTVIAETVKTYSMPISFCQVGVPTTENSMVHVVLKLLPGRSIELKNEMAKGLQSIVQSYVGDISATVEIQELEAETYCK